MRASDAALTSPQSVPNGNPAPQRSKLWSDGSRFSAARWPGGPPVDVVGVDRIGPPNTSTVAPVSQRFERRSGAGPASSRMSALPGPAASTPEVMLPGSVSLGLRFASRVAGSGTYHQSRSSAPSYAGPATGAPLITPSSITGSATPVRSSSPESVKRIDTAPSATASLMTIGSAPTAAAPRAFPVQGGAVADGTSKSWRTRSTCSKPHVALQPSRLTTL